MKLQIVKGKTSKSVDVFIRDTSVTTGAGLTGLLFNTASLTAYGHRAGSAPAAITLATLASVTTAWATGGFIAVDGTNMPGVYRLDIPDAWLATGVDEVVIMLKGAANMEPVVLEIQLVSVDPNDSVRMGMTALPNAAAAAAGGIFTRGTGAGQINQDANGRIDVNIAAVSANTTSATNLRDYTNGTTPIPANVTQNGGTNITAAGGRQEVNVSHYGGTIGIFSGGVPSVNTIQWRGTQPSVLISGRVDVSAGATQSGVITAATFATDAIDANALKADAVTEIATGVGALVVEAQGSITFKQFASLAGAVLFGVSANGGNTFLTPNGVATRVTATTNGSNERTAQSLSP